jgi:antitoxin MazE
MQIQTQIQKWGNDLGLRISGILRDLSQLQVNDEVQIEVTEQGFSVTKVIHKKAISLKYSEAQLLADITPEKAHAEVIGKIMPGIVTQK